MVCRASGTTTCFDLVESRVRSAWIRIQISWSRKILRSSTGLVPTIDGKLHHFTNAGLYDGLFTLYDAETHTLWNHITGEAEYGRWLATRQAANECEAGAGAGCQTEIAISDRVHLQEESSLGLRGIGGAAPATGESRTR